MRNDSDSVDSFIDARKCSRVVKQCTVGDTRNVFYYSCNLD